MDILLYIIIFIMGSLFGSFYSLAIHRIPLKQDIIKKHSYCPNCKEKLGILDLFPVFSYILLRGKCRHCKKSISPRYLALEIFSGLIFVLVAYFMGINIENVTILKSLEALMLALYFTYLIITIGIAKTKLNIEKSVNMYGIIISLIYMLYLCLLEETNIYRYGMYLAIYIIILMINTIILKKQAKSNKITEILLMLVILAIFTGELVTLYTIISTFLIIAIYNIIYKLRKNDNTKYINYPLYIGISNIITYVIVLIIMNN